MAVETRLQQWVVSCPYRIWSIISKTCVILFLTSLIAFICFYFRFYVPSIKEEFYINQTNCTISDTKTNNLVCDNEQHQTCELIIGDCFIVDHIQNLTVYSTWKDYDTSSAQCTIDPCLNSGDTFNQNQSFFSIYWSSYSQHGYLKRVSKLDINTTKIISYSLISIVIFTCMTSIILIYILHIYHKHQITIYPMSQSIRSQPPSIFIRKASKPIKDQIPTNLKPSLSSSKRLVAPTELTVDAESTVDEPIPIRSYQTLRKPLGQINTPATTSTSPGDNNAVIVQNINLNFASY